MIKIKPSPDLNFTCPKCHSTSSLSKNILFVGIHSVSDCLCKSCSTEFYHTVPTGHALYFPISFSKDGTVSSYSKKAEVWLAKPLIEGVVKRKMMPISISKQLLTSHKRIVILNCLDNCFGHALAKLLNAQYYLEKFPGFGLVAIIPESLKWMVPNGLAEIWSIKCQLKDLNGFLNNLDLFIQEEFKRFDEIYLSLAFLHHYFPNINTFLFFKEKRFNLDDFSSFPPQITFVLREDRLWTGLKVDYTVKVLQKYKVYKYFKPLFLSLQLRQVGKTARLIKAKFKDACFFATGIGRFGRLPDQIVDLRTDLVSMEDERKWNSVYSASHIVIGVHGSNMLIPSFLSAGIIELLPRNKIGNYMEDIAFKKNVAFSHFLCRLLVTSASAKLVALHAVELLRGFPQIYSESKIFHGKFDDLEFMKKDFLS